MNCICVSHDWGSRSFVSRLYHFMFQLGRQVAEYSTLKKTKQLHREASLLGRKWLHSLVFFLPVTFFYYKIIHVFIFV